MISTSWGKALKTVVEEYTQDGYEQWSDWSPQVYNIKDDSSGYFEYNDSFGPATIPASSEGASSPELSISNGYNTTAVPQIFKAKIPITEELSRWNKYKGKILDLSKAMGEAGIQTVNRFSAGTFIKGHTSTATSYGDAVPLFSTVHPRIDGGSTMSNSSTTSIALTEANLETAVIAMRQQKSGTGAKYAIAKNRLVLMVPESLEKEAIIITGSTLRSGTANNDLNWYKGNYNVFVNPWLGSDIYDMDGVQGSDTAWFLLDSSNHKVSMVWDVRPTYKMWDDEDTDTMYEKIYMSLQVLWKDWRGTWGSQGNGAAYSS